MLVESVFWKFNFQRHLNWSCRVGILLVIGGLDRVAQNGPVDMAGIALLLRGRGRGNIVEFFRPPRRSDTVPNFTLIGLCYLMDSGSKTPKISNFANIFSQRSDRIPSSIYMKFTDFMRQCVLRKCFKFAAIWCISTRFVSKQIAQLSQRYRPAGWVSMAKSGRL